MEMTRMELLPGVWLTLLRGGEEEGSWMSLNLLTQRTSETASMNALLPRVLCRGTARHGSAGELLAFEKQIGVTVTPTVRPIGDMQSLGFFASLEAGAPSLQRCCELLGELLLHPMTRGGLLLSAYVDEEREALAAELAARDEDPSCRAVRRCIEEMCCAEDYAARPGGEALASVRYAALSRHYRQLLPQSPVEILCCCRADKRQLASWLRDALSGLPRGELDEELGTELRMNALEAQPRRLTEDGVFEGRNRLVVGFRLGECMEEPDESALLVFARLLQDEMTKRLPDGEGCETLLDEDKGLLLVLLAAPETARAEEELFRLLDALRACAPAEEALHSACRSEAARLRALAARPRAREELLLGMLLRGLDCGEEELAALCEELTGEELQTVARSLDCDFIYTLCSVNEENEENEENGHGTEPDLS